MNQDDFKKLALEIRAGNNAPLEDIFQANASYCISNLIRKHGCSRANAEDIYSDAVLNFREKLVLGKIEYLTEIKAYLFATCRNMYLVQLKRDERLQLASKQIYDWYEGDVMDTEGDERVYGIMEMGLRSLPGRCYDLLKSFYFDRLSLEEIAKQYNMANGNVAKVSKARCFKKLVDYMKTEQKKLADAVE